VTWPWQPRHPVPVAECARPGDEHMSMQDGLLLHFHALGLPVHSSTLLTTTLCSDMIASDSPE